jgi:hypothetical protein
MRQLAFSLLFASALAATPVEAVTFDAPPDGTYRYTIEHSEHGTLGEHVVTLTSKGDERRVQVERHIKVERLWVTVHREDTRTEELWRDRSLVSFQRETVEGDKTTRLAIEERGGELVFSDSGKATGLPAGTYPTNPWNPGIVNETVLLDTSDGHAVRVTTKPAGEEQVVVGGVRLTAQRYEMQGDERRTLWYDGLGRLVRQQIHNADGSTITFTLQRLPDNRGLT